jgi:hypothetical protein
MAKATTKLNPQDRVILFCTATGIDDAAVRIPARAMQSMAIRGLIVHDRSDPTAPGIIKFSQMRASRGMNSRRSTLHDQAHSRRRRARPALLRA